MKRRQFLRWSSYGAIAATLAHQLPVVGQSLDSTDLLNITWLGHTGFIFDDQNWQILINPFYPAGCTEKYISPSAYINNRFPEPIDLILISSQMLDEGAIGDLTLSYDPAIISAPGSHRIKPKKELPPKQFDGILLDHANKPEDRGRRFLPNVAWSWQQGGLNIVHLGGAGAPITLDEKILLGRPDILVVPVGGQDNPAKGYRPEQAIAAINTLKPRMVIPSHYGAKGRGNQCDLVSVQSFLELLKTSTTETFFLDSDQITINYLSSNELTVEPDQLSPNKLLVNVFNDQTFVNTST